MKRFKSVLRALPCACALMAAGFIQHHAPSNDEWRMSWDYAQNLLAGAEDYYSRRLVEIAPSMTSPVEENEKIPLHDTRDTAQAAAFFNLRGVVRWCMYRSIEARRDYDVAIALNASRSDYYANRGIVLREAGEHQAAREDYARSLDLDRENAYAFNNLGWLELVEGKTETARKNFDRAIRIKEDFAIARINRLLADLVEWKDDTTALDRIEKGLQECRNFCRQAPTHPYALQCACMNLGEIARLRGKWNESLSYYAEAENAAKRCDRSPDGHRGRTAMALGGARFSMGRFEDAQRSFEAAFASLKNFPDSVEKEYAEIYSLVSKARAGAPNSLTLPSGTEQSNAWTEVLRDILRGERNRREIERMLAKAPDKDRAAMTCEAMFCLGERALLNRRNDDAVSLFRKSAEAGKPLMLEASMSRAELQRIQK